MQTESQIAPVREASVFRARVAIVGVGTGSVDEVLAPDGDIVVELMGGLEPAGELIRRALRAGKAVVTANKQLIAQQGAELLDLARAQDRQLLYEASVAGGIPVVRAIQAGLAGDRLVRIAGILN